MHKRTLAVHEIKLVVEAGPGFRDGSSVGQHGHGTVDRGEFGAGNRDGPGKVLENGV